MRAAAVHLAVVLAAAPALLAAPAAAQQPLPTLHDLPALGVPRAQLSPELRLAMEAVEDALAIRPPRYAPSMRAAQWDHFFKNPLTRFLRRRMEAVQRAQRAIASLAGDPAARVVGAALTGLLLENTARAIRGLPMPREIARDPDIAAVYRDALEEHVAPLRQSATSAYEACERWAAEAPAAHAAWTAFCSGRRGGV